MVKKGSVKIATHLQFLSCWLKQIETSEGRKEGKHVFDI